MIIKRKADITMSDWMNEIQRMMGTGEDKHKKSKESTGPNWGALLGSAALGGLAGALLSSKSTKKIAKQVLMVGGGAAAGAFAWDRYKKYMQEPSPAEGTSVDVRTERLIYALVFAAKSDGHIDNSEQQVIQQKLSELSLGDEAKRVIDEAIAQPLDPKRLAKGIQTQEEALEIYFLSRSVIDLDHFMERSYLDALATELNIPQAVRQAIEDDILKALPESV